MAIRAFRYNAESGLTDLSISVFDASDNLVTSAVMPETSVSGIYRSDINLNSTMDWGLVTSVVGNISHIFKLPYLESSNEIADKFFGRQEFLNISSDISFIKNIEGGRWKIFNNQMIFYTEDNITEVARFNLKDSSGAPTESNVFERERV